VYLLIKKTTKKREKQIRPEIRIAGLIRHSGKNPGIQK
jgi:hypothetical protein